MTDPIKEYEASKVAAQKNRKQHELDLWKTWKDSGEKPEHLQPLLKLYEPIIAQKSRAWRAKTIPESVFKAELQTHVIKAFQNFDPTRGVALNTHVESRLPKAMRYNNKHQNVGYLPEAQAGQIGPINKARDTLRDELGRDPTNDELADHMGMPPKRIEAIVKNMRRDIPMSRSAGAEDYDYRGSDDSTEHGFEEQQIAVAQHILPDIFPNKPDMVDVFHHTFGTNGYQQIQSTSLLAKKLGKTQAQISRLKTQMGDTLRRYMSSGREK